MNKRFTLRKEYFGGLIHDVKTMSCELLTPEEFEFMANLTKNQGNQGLEMAINSTTILSRPAIKKIDELESRSVLRRRANGDLFVNDVRLIPPPSTLPDHCLTAPLRVYDTITHICNLTCKHCCQSSHPGFVEQRRTVDQTAAIMQKFHDVGTMEWRFTGGEPTSCPDLIDEIRIAKDDLGMAVMLNTNGCWNPTMMSAIPKSGVDEIIVSLEGSEAVNDRRRTQGVHRQIMAVFDQIDQHNRDDPEHKIRVTINMTVSRDNAGELEYIIRLAAQHGYTVNFVPLRPFGRTVTDLQGDILSTEEFMKFSEQVQRLREDPQIRDSGIRIIHRNMDLFSPDYPDKSSLPYPFNYSECGALSTGMGLCPDGRINACSFLISDPDFVGPNLLDVSVAEAWLDPKMEHFRQARKLGCIGCRFYMRQCEGKCRAMVLANHGRIEGSRLIGHDPYCFARFMKP